MTQQATEQRERANDEQRNELRVAAQESRAAYERERDELLRKIAERLQVHRSERVGRYQRILGDALELAGCIDEYTSSLAACAAEMHDDEITKSVRTLRRAARDVGNLLAQRRQRTEPDRRLPARSTPAELSTQTGG